MEATQEQFETKTSWLDKPLQSVITINWETVLFGLIVLAAILTRFYDLGIRVMSHDESLHTYYSWRLYKGQGFEHTPLMHGPLQFHLIAFFYFLFGDTDFSARIFAVLTSIATVAMLWQFRSYLGRKGALITAGLMLISPFMLYYGRYVRNEPYVGLFGLLTIWAILRYLDGGEKKYLYYLTAATVLHFTAKETAFIYTAQALLFLGLLFVRDITSKKWENKDQRTAFIVMLILALIFLGAAGSLYFAGRGGEVLSATEVAEQLDPLSETESEIPGVSLSFPIYIASFAAVALLGALLFLVRGYGLERLRGERTLDMVVLLFTLVLPQLAPFLVRASGGNPLDYSSAGMARTATVVVPFLLVSIAVGVWWQRRTWLINAAIFYAIFTVFYTSVFTNGQGFFTGLVGSLGYWLEQQGVRRGNQPWYYYLLVQIPIYEYLPALGSLLALWYGVKRWFGGRSRPAVEEGEEEEIVERPVVPAGQAAAVPLLGFWVITSAAAYTVAGEKMPWLTFHIALPMILLTGWALGQLVDRVDWKAFREKRGWLILALLLIFVPALTSLISALIGSNPPFQGSQLDQLRATSNFLMSTITVILSTWGLIALGRRWQFGQLFRLLVLSVFGLLAMLTARTAFIATYVNYDDATEYLVYAHSASPVKDVLTQVEEISNRTAGDLSMEVAYDDDVSWPFTWYLRNYSNQRYYAANPTRDLRNVPVIIVGDNNFGKIEPVVGQAFYRFDYIRMVWPDQDYFNLTWERVRSAITDPQMRAALLDIWLNRDFTRYAELNSKDLSLANWSPSDRMRMYIRKDVAAEIWEYGIAAAPEELVADPYEGKGITLQPDVYFGDNGSEPGQFLAPRGIAVAADGSVYVANSQNHRIQHLSPDGSVLDLWGSFADSAAGEAPGGTFNEPWSVAVGPDGSVFVADTWNHRVQKFSSDGVFQAMWGFFGTAETPEAFWGPRDVTVDDLGRVFVTDTGNKRVVIFDSNGGYLGQFGEVGFAPGQFDEPVGVEVDAAGRVYVADTWNQRVPGPFSFGRRIHSVRPFQ